MVGMEELKSYYDFVSGKECQNENEKDFLLFWKFRNDNECLDLMIDVYTDALKETWRKHLASPNKWVGVDIPGNTAMVTRFGEEFHYDCNYDGTDEGDSFETDDIEVALEWLAMKKIAA